MLRLTAREMRSAIEQTAGDLDPDQCELLAPVESQEVWACGVTYARSREARMEESSAQDIYARVYEAERRAFTFVPGPVFANVVLVDELNRTPPRTQSAFLEAMDENAVTVD